MIKYIILSILLHILIAIPLYKKTPDVEKEINIKIVQNNITNISKEKGSSFDKQAEMSKARKEQESENTPFSKKATFTNYFSRIEQSVYLNWRDDVKKIIKIKKLKGSYKTVIWIIINKEGLVVETIMVEKSGVEELDLAAINSFKDKFFPNPPETLIDADGFGRILWAFNVIL